MKIKQIRVDGYKNLIDCKVDLGDFNVLVGPNNSGKSNLLEAIQMLGGICFENNELRQKIFEGLTPPNRESTWICHLKKYNKRALTIGLIFETETKGKPWRVDYEVSIKPTIPDKQKGGFVSETLKAKHPSATGPATVYIKRETSKFQVCKRERTIARDNCSFVAIEAIFPEYKGLPSELKHFISELSRIAHISIFALWPEGLRIMVDEEIEINRVHVSHFDPLVAIDNIKQADEKDYRLFKDVVCDILDLEDFDFTAEEIGPKGEGVKKNEAQKRVRHCTMKRVGNGYSDIREYSDGTFGIVGVLSALLSKGRKDSIFLLEEVEGCLHPAAVEKLIRFLQDNCERWPVLITTHSPYVLDKLNPVDVNVTVVGTDGSVHVRKVEDRKAINEILNNKYISFGDLLPTNFEDIIQY